MMAAGLRDLWHRYPVAITLGTTAALALGCYGFVLRLPFFFDDLPIMTYLSGRSWAEIWVGPPENPFYRPLTFSVYKLGRSLPPGADRMALHGVNLALHWLSACLMVPLLRLTGRSDEEAFLASVLFVVFPFKFMAVSWVTAMPHLLVTALTLTAVVAALKAEMANARGWWMVSLLATALAPMAHESGYVCGGIVAVAIALTGGLRVRRITLAALGILLNAGALLWRSRVPGAGQASFHGLQDWVGNTMFSLHGLVYPVAPLIGTLVHRFGVQDFLLVVMATIGLAALLVALVSRRGEWRWIALSLCWWGLGMLPAAASLRYGYNYTAPRVYSLASPGMTMMWAGVIASLSGWGGSRLRRVEGPGARRDWPEAMRANGGRSWMRLVAGLLLGGAMVTQNVTFLGKQQELFTQLNRVYERVFEVITQDVRSRPGFVNLPTSLAHGEKTYAMILESVLFLPRYSSFAEFLAVNGVQMADVVVYSPVVEESGYACGLRGDGLDWDEMRQFAVDHDEVWLARWRDGRLVLDQVGHIEGDSEASWSRPLVTFEEGIAVESAVVAAMPRDGWRVAIDWVAPRTVDGRIFVHVRDEDGDLVAQADGPALGGMVPSWVWQRGDRIHDVRYVSLQHGSPPFAVQVGLFDADGRLPAFKDGVRCADDVCDVTTFPP